MTKKKGTKKTKKKETKPEIQKRIERLQHVTTLYCHNYTLEEIANTLNISIRTVTRDLKLIKKQTLEKLKTIEKEPNDLIAEIGLQINEITKKYWHVYTTAENENNKLGALNGLTRMLGDKIHILERLGIIEHIEKSSIEIKPDLTDVINFLENKQKKNKDQ